MQQDKLARDGEINGLLNRATTALSSDKFDEAIALYDEVLKLDAGNGPAQAGKIGAVSAKRAAAAAANSASNPPVSAPTGKSFSADRTVKKLSLIHISEPTRPY